MNIIKITMLALAMVMSLSLPGCDLEDARADETPVAYQEAAPAVQVIYDQNTGTYGYWYEDVWYPAPMDFQYYDGVVPYWGPAAAVEPYVYLRPGFGYGYWCDGFWYVAPVGFIYRYGIHPYWGPCYVGGRYYPRGHYYGAWSAPGYHRDGHYVPHAGSYGYRPSITIHHPPGTIIGPPRVPTYRPPVYSPGYRGGYRGSYGGGYHGGYGGGFHGGGHFGGGHGGHR